MSKRRKKITTDRKPWDRRILSVQDSGYGKDYEHREMQEAEWNMHLFRLSTPVLVAKELSSVITCDDAIIYPPFEIDRGRAATQSLVGSRIPLREGSVELNPPATSHPTIGFNDNVKVCYGLRVDLRSGIGPDWDGLEMLLGLLRERSLQWWINSGVDPFDLGSRYVVRLNGDGSFTDGPVKAKEKSPWNVASSSKHPFGWEAVVGEVCWQEFGIYYLRKKKLETATTAFLDGLSSYMSKMDSTCIYQLCVSLEIMESKIRSASGKPTNAYALKLLKDAQLWQAEDKSLLTKIFADRGHIVHGLNPVHITKDERQIVEYLDLTKRYYERFLKMAVDIGWDKVSEL